MHLNQTIAVLDAETAILISLERCTYADSSVINAMVRLANVHDRRIVVVVPSTSQIRRIFEITGLIEFLHVVEDLDQAISLGEAMRALNAVTFSADGVGSQE